MSKAVVFDIDGSMVSFEVTDSGGSAFAAGAGDVFIKAEKPFNAAVNMIKVLSDHFATAFDASKVKEAEISLGLKVTAKGDFIVVGTSGEASLNLKLKLLLK